MQASKILSSHKFIARDSMSQKANVHTTTNKATRQDNKTTTNKSGMQE
jgi:hypothetical protein